MTNGMRVFDTHTHVGVALHSGRRYTADQLLADMDRYGVDRSLVIPFPMVEDYRAAHDEIGKAVRSHPDRLIGAACLNPFVSESSFRDEVRRCAQEFGFGVLKFQPQYQPLNPICSRGEFYFETALENKMALVCHTGTGIPFALPSAFMIPARNYPRLKFVLAHCGGGGILLGDAIVAAVFCPNIYLELSTLMPHHVLEVLTHVPASRLMVGSDLPESLETEMGKIMGLKIPEDARRDILWNTACSVFDEGR
jgi:predicted TIM-barrel fold metal-dependent hydrolase